MATKLRNLRIEISSSAKSVLLLMIEGRELTSQIGYTGDRWLAEFDAVEVDGNGKLDIVALVTGTAAQCSMRVSIRDHKPKTYKQSFKPNGWLIFSKALLQTDFTHV